MRPALDTQGETRSKHCIPPRGRMWKNWRVLQECGKQPLSGGLRQTPAYLVYRRRGEDVPPSPSARTSVGKGFLSVKNTE